MKNMKKMEECAIVNRCPCFKLKRFLRQIMGDNSRREKVVKSKIKLGLPFMISDLSYCMEIVFFLQ
jgi:hypothetical protein